MYTYSEFHGFKRADFQFEERDALIVFPKVIEPQRRWMMKMEYFGTAPSLEIELLKQGWHLCHLSSINRWGTDADSDARVRFAEFIAKQFGLERKFICIGMSCGGLCAVNFAARYPEYTSLLYLDAPVMNLLSCPMGFGIGEPLGSEESGLKQIEEVYGLDLPSLLTWREHPMDKIPVLAEHKIPVALVYGDSDTVVPYVENGIVLEKYYREHNLPLFCEGKKGGGHHPHGLEDITQLAVFIDCQTKKTAVNLDEE